MSPIQTKLLKTVKKINMFESLDKNKVKVKFRVEKLTVYFHAP